MSMKRTAALGLAALAGALWVGPARAAEGDKKLAQADAKKDAAEDMKKMEGTWKVAGNEFNGMKVSAEDVKKENLNITIKGNQYTMKSGDKVIARGTFTLDPAKKPKTLDVTTTE